MAWRIPRTRSSANLEAPENPDSAGGGAASEAQGAPNKKAARMEPAPQDAEEGDTQGDLAAHEAWMVQEGLRMAPAEVHTNPELMTVVMKTIKQLCQNNEKLSRRLWTTFLVWKAISEGKAATRWCQKAVEELGKGHTKLGPPPPHILRAFENGAGVNMFEKMRGAATVMIDNPTENKEAAAEAGKDIALRTLYFQLKKAWTKAPNETSDMMALDWFFGDKDSKEKKAPNQAEGGIRPWLTPVSAPTRKGGCCWCNICCWCGSPATCGAMERNSELALTKMCTGKGKGKMK